MQVNMIFTDSSSSFLYTVLLYCVIGTHLHLPSPLKPVHSVLQEFLAYQRHSSDLLRKERELNSKLRHVSDL